MATPPVGIFVATMTGTADMCAEEIQAALDAVGIDADRRPMDGLDHSALDPYSLIVIVSSTYGHGDIPDNGQALFQSLEEAASLGTTRFAVFGLGDSTYATTFCEAGRKWDELLASKGAIRLAPLVQHDASSGTLAEDIAGSWAAEWAGQFKEAG